MHDREWIYVHGRSKGGPWEHGYPSEWRWSRGGGEYDTGRDFFCVHWEIHPERFAGIVRLHVESPRYEDDPVLNDLKHDVVGALIGDQLERRIRQAGWGYDIGRFATPLHVQRTKSTEAFRVLLTADQQASDASADITAVHAVVGSDVSRALGPFADRLVEQFGR